MGCICPESSVLYYMSNAATTKTSKAGDSKMSKITQTLYRVYEAYENEVGGVEGCGAGWEHIKADSAEAAAKEFAEEFDSNTWNEDTVIVATDDNGDSDHYYPAR